MARNHVDDLFSAAYDGELNEKQAVLFDAHIQRCTACAHAFSEFQQTVDAVRALPGARMPRPVHIPSTQPVAEVHPLRARLRLPRFPRLLPGGATVIAAVTAAVILVLVNRAPGGSGTTAGGPALSHAGPEAGAASSSCPVTLAGAALQPPAAYQHRVRASDPGRPGQELLLATETGDALPGQKVVVFAQLSLPRQSAAAPGADSPVVDVGALPCLSVNAAAHAVAIRPLASGGGTFGTAATPGPHTEAQTPGQLVTLTVPPDAAPGSQIHVQAQVPPGYPDAGQPPLTLDLVITVR